ncbi:MAG: FecR domain-containing protein [Myxococcales bacterium]|nr:FecR domain-containing protein [Myxococcales bacterium]
MLRILPLPCLCLAVLLAFAPAALAEDVGFVASTIGDVQIDRGDDGSWQAARRDSGLAIGDRIRTALGASAKIVLVDDTLLQIDEDTDLLLESFHVGAAATQERSILRQTRGRLRATVGDAFGGSTRIEVHTPTAAIGVKGTDFEVVKAALWEACLLSGGIDVTNPYGAAAPRPGYCVYAYGDKAPGDEFPNPRDPLSVGDSTTADSDFEEKIRRDVAGDGPNPLAGIDPDDSGENREDEYETGPDSPPIIEIEEEEPIRQPQDDDVNLSNEG